MIQDAQAWLRAGGAGDRPWLLIDGTASPKLVAEATKDGFAVLAIAGSAARHRCDVAFIVDIEQIAGSGEQIAANARVVLMPNEPHQNGFASGKPLAAYMEQMPVLRQLSESGRLLGFDLWTSRSAPAESAIAGELDTEEVPLRILSRAGIKRARHLTARSRPNPPMGLEASHSLIERRTGGIAAIRREFGLSYGPYDYPVAAEILIGSDDQQMLGLRVLHYSIEKHSTMDVRLRHLDYKSLRVPVEAKNRSKTGFSFCRFDIPRLCDYRGRGVYLDADMLVFTDIQNLWTMPLDDADVLFSLTHPSQGRTPQTSVMLLNCEALHWDVDDIIRGLDENRYSYKELMSDMCVVKPGRAKPLLPYWWNSLELYEPGRTSLLHYTDMTLQPWISHDNENGELWYRACAEALETGFIAEKEIEEAIDDGCVSPDFFKWIGRPAKDYGAKSATWIAPYHRFVQPKAPEGAVVLTPDKQLVGWAWNPTQPDEPIEIGLFDGESCLLTIKCDRPGQFLARHGKGNGEHAFDLPLPDQVLQSNVHQLSVRTLDRKFELRGSPVRLS